MERDRSMSIAVVGTFDTKGEEHRFIMERIEERGFKTVSIHVGTRYSSPFPVDLDMFLEIRKEDPKSLDNRDTAIEAVRSRTRERVRQMYEDGRIRGIISAGGGTGTHLGTSIMKVLPLGVPKVMLSTVASKNMASAVGTKDITMIHSVVDILGVNSISGMILDRAAGAVCGMAESRWNSKGGKKRIGMTFFGFITEGAEHVKRCLETLGYEVIPFHANGTGGMAMEELAGDGYFDGLLDLATHELADELKGGYCRGIGPDRLMPDDGKAIPRLVVPGGLDCAVLEFTRSSVPPEYENRRIFFYDFRSAVRLNQKETLFIADQLSGKLNQHPDSVRLLIPLKGWSEADIEGGALFDPVMTSIFIERVRANLDSDIEIREIDFHINEKEFAEIAAEMMHRMIRGRR
ncbi:MAG: Tm-1-like ATP-binding domain-containing protein [Thermodesulfobacteriota bacterium]